ncbi:MAG: hypothetical protein WD768_05375 [Phycisphaeraceae bacterium]
MIRTATILSIAILLAASGPAFADNGLKEGAPGLKSAGSLTFGPTGILFVADTKGAAIFAIDTGDISGDASSAKVNVDKLGEKVAAMLGTKADQVQINDIAANPASGNVYLSVSRGRGPDALPVILRVTSAGKIEELKLDKVKFARASLPNAPEDKVTGTGTRQSNARNESITDMAFIENQVIVAGLSNEDFASNLRAIPFPFKDVNDGAGIEIYHGAHGKLETRSPVRTFVPINFGTEPQIIAAYTCTPLVRIPLSELKPGAKVRGTTIAELGNRNRPLDIVAYTKGGKHYLLMANSARGVMKIGTDQLYPKEGINEKVSDKAGQTYDTVGDLKDVTQLDKLNDTHAVILIEANGGAELKTIALP